MRVCGNVQALCKAIARAERRERNGEGTPAYANHRPAESAFDLNAPERSRFHDGDVSATDGESRDHERKERAHGRRT